MINFIYFRDYNPASESVVAATVAATAIATAAAATAVAATATAVAAAATCAASALTHCKTPKEIQVKNSYISNYDDPLFVVQPEKFLINDTTLDEFIL